MIKLFIASLGFIEFNEDWCYVLLYIFLLPALGILASLLHLHILACSRSDLVEICWICVRLRSAFDKVEFRSSIIFAASTMQRGL